MVTTSTVGSKERDARSQACLFVLSSVAPFTLVRISCLGNGATHSGLGLSKLTNN